MSLLPLIAQLLSGEDAEARQFFYTKDGKKIKKTPLQFQYKTFKDVFGEEPKTQDDYFRLKKQAYNKELYKARQKQIKTGNPIYEAAIIADINDKLSQVAMYSMGVKYLEDITPKFLEMAGVPEKDRGKFNQLILENPKDPQTQQFVRNFLGYAFGPSVKKGKAPLGTGVEYNKYDPDKELAKYRKTQEKTGDVTRNPIDITSAYLPGSTLPSFYGNPSLPKLMQSEESQKQVPNLNPLVKVNIDPNDLIGAATTILHEVNHSLADYYNPEHIGQKENPDVQYGLGKYISMEDVDKMSGSAQHFPRKKINGKDIGGLDDVILKSAKPNWFKSQKNPNRLKRLRKKINLGQFQEEPNQELIDEIISEPTFSSENIAQTNFEPGSLEYFNNLNFPQPAEDLEEDPLNPTFRRLKNKIV